MMVLLFITLVSAVNNSLEHSQCSLVQFFSEFCEKYFLSSHGIFLLFLQFFLNYGLTPFLLGGVDWDAVEDSRWRCTESIHSKGRH